MSVIVLCVLATLASLLLVTGTSGRSGPRRRGRSQRPRHTQIHRSWRAGDDDARWARRRDLRSLQVPVPQAGRLTLGVSSRRLVALDAGHSLLVVGPTQSGKTTGLAVPALLEWQGPVVAASVKTDLVRDTVAWRRGQGTVWIYDPTASTDLETSRWSPLDAVSTWSGARRVAAGLVDAGRTSPGALTDGDFWYATAAKLLAPLLLAAATSGRTMADVVRWIDEQETDEVLDALDTAGQSQALQALRATWGRDERQRSAVYSTAETVVEVFADPDVSASAGPGRGRIDPAALLDAHHSLYLCAPAHEQRRLRPLFTGLVSRVIEAAYDRASRQGRPLDPPLLVVLDEAANVAPLAELDVLASTAAGHGIHLVTVWQDLAQLTARYGPRAGSVVNNHRAKLFLSGIADPTTLDHASALIGEAPHPVSSTTVDRGRSSSTTTTPTYRRLVPADALRRLAPGTGILISGHLPPARLTLRPWYRDRELRRRAGSPGDR
ncbi:MAG TPA: type IV secretory system conjugative DNA transfer family protein [Acidimicrobiales bacterium]|nr:type IV secretory system conjugative DNA transfer family protein [Acidimicrobiales bacterium]